MLRSKGNEGLGFRDFSIFNQALLSTQAWRLLEFPDSLYTRILKAKYCPNGHLLDTVFCNVASPMWRAVERSLELLKKGVIWRVGNGRSIKIGEISGSQEKPHYHRLERRREQGYAIR